jgi:hypothetical protein
VRTKTLAFLLPTILALAAARIAAAQPPGQVAPGAPDLPSFDVSAGLGWFNATFEDVPGGRHWYNDAAWWGAHVGYYWTENLKLEAEVSASGEGRGWSAEESVLPGGRPVFLYREHGLSARTLSGSIVYQFGHNSFLHPFLGAGVDVDFTREVVRATGFTFVDPRGQEPLPPIPDETLTNTRGGVFALVGVKAYFTGRVFFRGDFKAGTSGPERKIIGRAMFGVDF